jgi:tetratricopeptide (TPR) repeat protein
VLAVLAVLAVLVGSASAAEPDSIGEAGYSVRGFDQRIQDGIDLIYNLRFEAADGHFERIIAAEPENPVGYFFLAMVTWWRVLSDLDSSEHDRAFYALLDRCVKVCDRRLEADPKDFDAILFKGGAIGFRGRLRGDRGEYLKAAGDGLKSLPLLKKSRQLEPANKDILFGQGIYNYFAEVMPERHPIIRPIMFLLPDGDREKGLAQLEEVAREGQYASAEAAYFLAQIHRIFEENRLKALEYLEYLHERYPDNALFHRYRARNLAELGRWRRAVPLYKEYVERSCDGQSGYHVHGRLEALYYLGKYAFFQRRLGAASDAFAAVDSLGGASQREDDQAYVALANLMLGMTCDLQGAREQAVKWYERVRKLKNQGESRDLAKKYLKEPYGERRKRSIE